MKLSSIILVVAAGVIAIAVGWIYQSQNKSTDTRAKLEIPVDIDYYLSKVKYRVMAKSGDLDYELRSPYLQHFKREDISRMDKPEINIYRNGQQWQVEANTAEMKHKINTLELIENVRLKNMKSRINADRALFDLNKNIYSLTNTRAVYTNEKN